MNAKTSPQQFNFNGFDDWFEIFRAGTHTDSNGNQRTWTLQELDTIVANHEAVPLVFGHPKTNHPAYGWTAELKREGDVLFAKAADVVDEFAEAVGKKMFPKRSISVEPHGDGFKLRHIGFLGAVRPAVSGLKDLAFNRSEDAATFEFAIDDAVRSHGYVLQTIGNAFRRFRDWMISENGLEQADEVLPDWMITSLTDAGADTRAALAEHHFTSPNIPVTNPDTNQPEGAAMPNQFSQADIDAAVAKANADAQAKIDAANARATALEKADAEKQFAAMKAKAEAVIDTAVKDGRLLPAQTPGLAEFMAQLAADAETTFEFAADDGTKKQTPYEFMADFIGALGKQIKLGGRKDDDPGERLGSDFAAPTGAVVDEDRAELDRKAQDYARENKVDYITAVVAVSGGK